MSRIRLRSVVSALSVAVITAGVTLGAASYIAPTEHTLAQAEADVLPTTVGVSDSGALLWSSDAELNTTLSILDAAGIKSLRVSIPWASVEPVQNQLVWTAVDRVVNAVSARGISMLGIIAYTPAWATSPPGQPINTRPASPALFGQFAGKVAARYKGKIEAYEIWNEPNGAMFYGPSPDAAGYTDLLKSAYPAIKSADAGATVVGGVLGSVVDMAGVQNPVSFMQQMYAAGAGGKFDALSFHPYQYSLKFADGVYVDDSPARQVMDIRAAMVANGDGNKKIWATEYGVPTAVTSEEQQSDMITHFITKWQELPYAGPIYLYQLRDQQTGSADTEMTFGLLRSDWSGKPALWGVMSQLMNNVPRSAEYDRFQMVPSGLGAPLSPVFPIRDTWAQIREYATVFQTPAGFIASPNVVAEAVRRTGLLPTTGFANGYQDFDSPYGLRVFSTDIGGTRLVGGGIISAWDPTLGPATSDETPVDGGGVRVTFQYGSITWTPAAGARAQR
ncbi:cellulase family glycosylhydrolase [Rhodococcoides kyotonense]|uniref:LGFP repeat-containing protein n=1 Tax=Rhodococcoides kyotonense TaxID=398843 RepID=A0A239J694_9NOCA|nr:cellulase family glycosylhydrolase [Rhodococcus kyotonensis]SNT01345.1 LGFP repeat-containing protein [Rhodococcus kyotonensis]